MKLLVTGGAGFIGSHIAQEAIRAGHDVVIFDNLFTGNLDNIGHIKDQVTLIQGDIMDQEALNQACKGVDWVSHQAALRSVPMSVKKPQDYNKVNIQGTFNVLEAARICDVKKVVFASSSSVYGNLKTFPAKEDMLTLPVSPYAITKLTGEHYMHYFYEQYGMQTASLRYFNVFGERQDPTSQYAAVIALFIKNISQGKPISIHWDGEQSRDFTYVKNNALANLAALSSENLKGQAFNISEGKSISINELVKQIEEIFGKKALVERTDKRSGDVRKTLGDTTKAKEQLNFEISVPFEEGLKKTAQWFTT